MAFFQDPQARQPFLRVPASVIGLIGLLALAHGARMLANPKQQDVIAFTYGFVPARYSSAFLQAHGYNPGSLFDRAIPFVSYIFIHANLAHLAVNSVWLLPFGAVVARRFGAGLFFLFFLICGAAGAATHLACNWGSTEPVIGASAAVAGLMAAGFRMIRYPPDLDQHWEPLAPIYAPRILIWSALWVVINIVAGMTGLGVGTGAGLVAWQAHLGGYAAGLLLAGPFDRIRRVFRPGTA
jgi:membrane associated rhomboid family serine protease